jgi:hypothetical protein
MNERKTAERNLELLSQNVYPGRGIVCGMDETGQYLIQAYWITGRSKKSRNRIFIYDETDGSLKTNVADPNLLDKNDNLDLIIYTAMAEKNLRYVVSNGHQTMTVINGPVKTGILPLLKKWEYEPDGPIFTPRITASIFLGEDIEDYKIEMAIFRKDGESKSCLKIPHFIDPQPGFGYCITTYLSDGNPPPPFSGQPYILPLAGDIDEVIDTIWSSLNEDNRVAMAVKFIDITTGKSQIEVINKYAQVEV